MLSSFTDAYASTNPNRNSFFGNLSFVIHDNASNRLACANFQPLSFLTQKPKPETESGPSCDQPEIVYVYEDADEE
jgi:hypothetical protein